MYSFLCGATFDFHYYLFEFLSCVNSVLVDGGSINFEQAHNL